MLSESSRVPFLAKLEEAASAWSHATMERTFDWLLHAIVKSFLQLVKLWFSPLRPFVLDRKLDAY